MMLTLTGLWPNNPLAVMAAYGVLRLLPDATLSWAGAHPALACDGDPVARLAALLPERRQAPETTRFDKPDAITDYREGAAVIPSDWLLAYAAEGAEELARTNLKLLGGRHQFIVNAREIMTALTAQDAVARVREALLGPWHYERGLQAWGWDAAANIDTAASSKDGSSTPKYAALGAAWLAWESLPLWPMVNGRTLGWSKGMRYLTTDEAVGWHELRALLLGRDALSDREREALGVREWHAPRIATSQYGGVFGWAHPVPRTPSTGEKPGGSRTSRISTLSPAALIV